MVADGPTRGVEESSRRRGAELPAPAFRPRARPSGAFSTRAGPTPRRRTSRCAGPPASCAAPPATAPTSLRCAADRALRRAGRSVCAAPVPALRGKLSAATPRSGRRRGRPDASWRQDDTRLHIDAFPSNPMHGTRLLRVFCNVNPGGPREWRVGEPFEEHARRYLRRSAGRCRARPGCSRRGITKRRRTEYDHVMLQLHDRAKADLDSSARSAGARRLRARHDLGRLQRPGAARRDGRPAHDGADLLPRCREPAPSETSPLRTLERLLGRQLR